MGSIRLRSGESNEARRRDPTGATTARGAAWGPRIDEPGNAEADGLVPLTTAIRWATAAVALLLAATGDSSTREAVAGAVVLAYALFRTIRPLQHSGGVREAVPALILEAAVIVLAVVNTGHWNSPYVFGLVTVISAAGFAGGIHLAVYAAAACVVAVALPYHLATRADVDLTVQWGGELVVVAVLAGFARRLSLEGQAEASQFLTRFQQLTELNALLLQLHDVAKTISVPLDLDETLESSEGRIRDLVAADAVAILLRDDNDWSVAKASGPHLEIEFTDADLPYPLKAAMEATGPTLLSLHPPNQAGLATIASSGIYVPLRARGVLIGLLAVERTGPSPFDAGHATIVGGFAEQMALAVDNARLFSRIATLAADQERGRIARDLHDRVGQSLALVGFELDRIAKDGSDPELRLQLADLRGSVRSVVSELRETLYDLRTDVSEDCGLVAALTEFIERVEARSKLEVCFDHRETSRLPLQVEREAWRIAQEAITNAERHSGAASVDVRWTTSDAVAELSVSDNGVGMATHAGPRRSGSYGLVGMQERARAIGAVLEVASDPAEGTTVRLTIQR